MVRHMPKPKQLTHFCEACQVKHTFIENKWPFWNYKEQNGKKIYWCNKGIDCAGCKKIHKRIGITKTVDLPDGRVLWLCNKWFKKHGNGEIDWENWSPQEVMSGVHMGFDRDKEYGPDTENHSIVMAEQKGQMEEALDILQEEEVLDGRWR